MDRRERERVTQVLYFLGNQFSGKTSQKKYRTEEKQIYILYNLIYGL
jgi:hypothetical protein